MDEVTISTAEAMVTDLETPSPAFTSAFAQHGAVMLLVGLDEVQLVAHVSYLTKNSEFFQAAMKREWAEGQTNIIKLPKDDPKTMTDYLTFTYSRDLPTSKRVEGCPNLTEDDWNSVAKLYVFGERVLDTCIRNTIVSEIVRVATMPDAKGNTSFIGSVASNILFDGTPKRAPIRRLIVDEHISNGKKDWLDATDNPELLLDLAHALLEKVSCRQPYEEFRRRKMKAEDYFV